MGLTTQYLRYVPGPVFGLVGSSTRVRFVTRFSQTGKYVAVPACELVLVWDTRRGTKVLTLDGGVKGVAVVLEPRPPTPGTLDNTHLAVGYTNGSLVIFDLRVGEPVLFNGHKGGISTLCWDPQGMRVATGSEDGEIVIWDVVSERGVVRLRGHRGRITRLRFMQERNVVVSSCRDSFIKFWDVDINHCFRTITGHHAEVGDFVLLRNDTRLISGSSDAELRVWSLHFTDTDIKKEKEEGGKDEVTEPPNKMFYIDTKGSHDPEKPEEVVEDDASVLQVCWLGSVLRSRGDRVCGLSTDGRVVACHGKSPVIDLFAILTDEEVEAKVAKRARKRARDAGNTFEGSEAPQLSDEISKLPSLRAKNKVAGVDVLRERTGSTRTITLHVDNSLALYLSSQDQNSQAKDKKIWDPVSVIELPGHRTEVRAAAFTSLSDQMVTLSADCLKMWHRGEQQAVTTLGCEEGSCVVLVPGDRHALVGTRSGRILLLDLSSATIMEDLAAHLPQEEEEEEGGARTDVGVWSLALTHDGRGFVSGGSDKLVKFWRFELVRDEGGGKRLSFMQDSRILKVADQVTCVRCSSSGKFLAVATLDLKETVYFMDSLKLCHELYGKSLPATCMEFSTDATLIVTGSKDSSLRIYGTDFGDMRKLLKNAHQGGVTDLRFISKTHMFFSCGHDGTVKQWDGDNFQRIITLEGHTGIVRCLAVCPKGAWVLSGGQDRSLRLWQRTQEPLVLEDEREEERRREEETTGAAVTQRPVVAGEGATAQAVRPSLTTHHTEHAADQILEALAIYREQVEAGPSAEPHYLMTHVHHTTDPLKFVLGVLRKVKSSELEEAVLVLPLDRVLELLVVVRGLLERGWDTELAARVLVTAVRLNLPQLLSSSQAGPLIHALATLLPQRTQQEQDLVGFNLAGLQHLKDRAEQRSQTQLFVEAAQQVKQSRRKRKKKDRAVERVLMSL